MIVIGKRLEIRATIVASLLTAGASVAPQAKPLRAGTDTSH
jgi:hypothetical protein